MALALEDQFEMQDLKRSGCSQAEIARITGRSPATVRKCTARAHFYATHEDLGQVQDSTLRLVTQVEEWKQDITAQMTDLRQQLAEQKELLLQLVTLLTTGKTAAPLPAPEESGQAQELPETDLETGPKNAGVQHLPEAGEEAQEGGSEVEHTPRNGALIHSIYKTRARGRHSTPVSNITRLEKTNTVSMSDVVGAHSPRAKETGLARNGILLERLFDPLDDAQERGTRFCLFAGVAASEWRFFAGLVGQYGDAELEQALRHIVRREKKGVTVRSFGGLLKYLLENPAGLLPVARAHRSAPAALAACAPPQRSPAPAPPVAWAATVAPFEQGQVRFKWETLRGNLLALPRAEFSLRAREALERSRIFWSEEGWVLATATSEDAHTLEQVDELLARQMTKVYLECDPGELRYLVTASSQLVG